jgi:hypothetical protein
MSRFLQSAPWAIGFALVGALAATVASSLRPAAVAQEPAKAPLRHVVLFKFKDDATKEQVAGIVQAFGELPKKIDGITDFEWGTDISPEGKSEGFTHCFVVTFADEKARDAYLPHQAHKDFVAILLPHLDKVLVVDYFARK